MTMRGVGFLVVGFAVLASWVSPASAADGRSLDCPTLPNQQPWPKPGDVRVAEGSEVYQPTSFKTVFVAGEGGYQPFELFVGQQEMYKAGNVPDGYYVRPEYGFRGRVSCNYVYAYARRQSNDGAVSVNAQFVHAKDVAPSGIPRADYINCAVAARECTTTVNELRGETGVATFLTIRFSEAFPDGEICLMGGWSGPPYPHPSIELYVDGARMVHIPHESLSGLDGAVPCQGAGSARVLAAMKRAKRVDYKRVRQQGDRWYSDPNHDHEYMTEKSLKSLGELCDFASWLLRSAVLSNEREQAELKLRPAADALLQQPVPGEPPFQPRSGN